MSTKDQLLSHLRRQKREWVSGESLSNKMGVTRSAIWKHISKLREEGYVIASSPKRGYRLQKIPQMLFPTEIKAGLNTKVFGKKDIVYFKETDSTNTQAKDLATKGAPEGTLVISERQTMGRGRKGRKWFSPARKGIYISLILRPTIPPSEAPKLTLLTAVVVAETLLSLTELEVNIKWPNDILVKGRKLAGILTEISTEMDEIDYMVVGLGMNVDTPDFPDDIRETATSIFIETGMHLSRVKLVREYLTRFERYYEMFREVGFDPIIKRWKTLTDIIGRQIIVQIIDEKYTGKVHDIDHDGALILKDKKGVVHRIFSGDITLL